jgi:POT family proton-dependent oligopeptide transporter
LQVREEWGIEYVLIMSSITTFMLFIGTMIFFKEPPVPPDTPRRTFGRVFSDMLLVFGNVRFMALILIMSGYWMMFWHIFYLLPFYGTDVLHFAEFELLETVDAACIIFLTVPMTALVKKWKPITAITAGLLVSSLSWAIIGAFATLTAAIIGVAVWAAGEAMQTPRFYEYVSSLAPKGQVGTFMGFAFLPVALGSFGAGPVSDWLRTTYLHTNPSMMWYILTGIGLLCTLLMVIYNAVAMKNQNT